MREDRKHWTVEEIQNHTAESLDFGHGAASPVRQSARLSNISIWWVVLRSLEMISAYRFDRRRHTYFFRKSTFAQEVPLLRLSVP